MVESSQQQTIRFRVAILVPCGFPSLGITTLLRGFRRAVDGMPNDRGETWKLYTVGSDEVTGALMNSGNDLTMTNAEKLRRFNACASSGRTAYHQAV